MEATSNPISQHEMFKAYNWWGDGNRRSLYFSLRLETLVRKLGLRGMVRSDACKQEPTPEDLVWVEDKLRLLKPSTTKLARHGEPDAVRSWFKDYLKRNLKKNPAVHDFTAFEKKHRVKLPKTYKEFLAGVGTRTFKDVDGEEGFCVHILPPKKLEVAECLARGDEESESFKGVLFATTDHGDAFYFAVSGKGSDYEVRKNDHEIESFEPYAENFAEAIKRFAGV